jgi:Fe-S cluster assembly protein SufD
MTEQKTQPEIALSSFFEMMKNEGARDMRAAGWFEFARKGLPNRRVESWHYTDLRGTLRTVAPLAEGAAVTAPLPTTQNARLVLLDGAYRADLSDAPAGVTVLSLRDALAQGDEEIMAALAPVSSGADDPLVSLNAALMQDGVVVRIAAGAKVDRPVEIASFASGAANSIFTRSLVIAGEGAQATIVETACALSPCGAQENHALVFFVDARAKIEHVVKIGSQAEDAIRVFSLMATLEESSQLNSFCLIEGGGFLRRQIFARLVGKAANVAFNGATLLRGRQHADTTLIIDHLAPGGVSRERFRTILDGSSTGVFQGKVAVRREAQKTDGSMHSKALLLSGLATMNNKPELEIFADDVLCGHGATCGRLDADQLFYLMARGFPRRQAEALLIEGFVVEALESVVDETMRESIAASVGAWLENKEDAQ